MNLTQRKMGVLIVNLFCAPAVGNFVQDNLYYLYVCPDNSWYTLLIKNNMFIPCFYHQGHITHPFLTIANLREV